MIKFAHDAEFSNRLFEGMDNYLKEQFPVEEIKTSAFSELTAVLVKCASTLEEMGHPKARQADRLLEHLAKHM